MVAGCQGERFTRTTIRVMAASFSDDTRDEAPIPLYRICVGARELGVLLRRHPGLGLAVQSLEFRFSNACSRCARLRAVQVAQTSGTRSHAAAQ